MPSRLASGAKTCCDSRATCCGQATRAAGVPAQRLQPRGQAQQHHPQVAREGQQHLAHALGLLGLRRGIAHRVGGARGALDLHQLARVPDQAGVAVAEGLGHHLFGPLQPVAGVHQVGRGLHRRRRADAAQYGGHAVGMRQRVFAGVEPVAGEQRLGERTRADQCGLAMIGLARHRPGARSAPRLRRAGPPSSSWAEQELAHRLAPDRAAPASAHGRHRRTRPGARAAHVRSWPWRSPATADRSRRRAAAASAASARRRPATAVPRRLARSRA